MQLGDAPRLRFGVIIDREWLPEWQLAVIDALRDRDDTEFALVLAGHEIPAPQREQATAYQRVSLWRLYNNGFVARRARGVRRAGRWNDVAAGVPVLELAVERRGRYSQYASDADVEKARAANL